MPRTDDLMSGADVHTDTVDLAATRRSAVAGRIAKAVSYAQACSTIYARGRADALSLAFEKCSLVQPVIPLGWRQSGRLGWTVVVEGMRP